MHSGGLLGQTAAPLYDYGGRLRRQAAAFLRSRRTFLRRWLTRLAPYGRLLVSAFREENLLSMRPSGRRNINRALRAVSRWLDIPGCGRNGSHGFADAPTVV